MIHGDACFPYFNKIWGIPCFRQNAYLNPGSQLAARHDKDNVSELVGDLKNRAFETLLAENFFDADSPIGQSRGKVWKFQPVQIRHETVPLPDVEIVAGHERHSWLGVQMNSAFRRAGQQPKRLTSTDLPQTHLLELLFRKYFCPLSFAQAGLK